MITVLLDVITFGLIMPVLPARGSAPLRGEPAAEARSEPARPAPPAPPVPASGTPTGGPGGPVPAEQTGGAAQHPPAPTVTPSSSAKTVSSLAASAQRNIPASAATGAPPETAPTPSTSSVTAGPSSAAPEATAQRQRSAMVETLRLETLRVAPRATTTSVTRQGSAASIPLGSPTANGSRGRGSTPTGFSTRDLPPRREAPLEPARADAPAVAGLGRSSPKPLPREPGRARGCPSGPHRAVASHPCPSRGRLRGAPGLGVAGRGARGRRLRDRARGRRHDHRGGGQHRARTPARRAVRRIRRPAAIGHACGHNIICAAALGPAWRSRRSPRRSASGSASWGRPPKRAAAARHIGFLEAGRFSDVHAALMVHPWPQDFAEPALIAVQQLTVTYRGREAHAAAFPMAGHQRRRRHGRGADGHRPPAPAAPAG